MKATDLLKKQHAKVRSLFKKLDKGGPGTAGLALEIANNLAAHMAIEQEIFYPAVRSVDKELVLEAFEEHALAEIALKRLLAIESRDPSHAARVTAAMELIEHHVKEEEGELFPKCERKLGVRKLERLGLQMEERFAVVLEKGFEKAAPKGFGRTSADRDLKKKKKPRARGRATR
jgi:hypothetical protein